MKMRLRHKLYLAVVIAALFLFATPALAQAHTVTLTATASADAVANPTLTYNMYRANTACSSAATFTKINTAPITQATGGNLAYTDSGLQPGSYCYQATSLLNGVESTASNQASAVILPAPPSSLAAKPN